MPSLRRRIALLVTAVSLWATGSTSAGQIAFDFSSLNVNSSNSQISSLMTSQAGSTVTVTGAQVNTNYTGDGHVVGPKIGSTIVPWTLGDSGGTVSNPTAPTTTNPTYKPYLANAVPGGPNGSSTTITMKFNTPIYAVTFDFEIFPDGTWDPNNPTQNVPDFEFSAMDNSNHVVAAQYNGSMTNLPWIVYGVTPGSVDPYLPGSPTTYTHSTVSGTGSNELVPQLIGAVTFVFSTNAPATQLTFADWPQQIGINNLIINPNGVTPFTSAVPAPSSAVLLGFGAVGIAGFVARSRRRVLGVA